MGTAHTGKCHYYCRRMSSRVRFCNHHGSFILIGSAGIAKVRRPFLTMGTAHKGKCCLLFSSYEFASSFLQSSWIVHLDWFCRCCQGSTIFSHNGYGTQRKALLSPYCLRFGIMFRVSFCVSVVVVVCAVSFRCDMMDARSGRFGQFLLVSRWVAYVSSKFK